MATKIGVSAGGLGNPSVREDGTLQGGSAPVPASPSTPRAQSTPEEMAPVLAARERQARVFQATEDRLPQPVTARDQAKAAGAE
jgi:hypothetical protein